MPVSFEQVFERATGVTGGALMLCYAIQLVPKYPPPATSLGVGAGTIVIAIVCAKFFESRLTRRGGESTARTGIAWTLGSVYAVISTALITKFFLIVPSVGSGVSLALRASVIVSGGVGGPLAILGSLFL